MPLPERQLIAQLRRAAQQQVARSHRAKLIAGIGDDCAVLRPPAKHDLLVTTDFSLEGIHFRRDWYPPEIIGHRCLARGLSDIAAMGGEPFAAFLSLGLPPKLAQKWVDGFLRGLLELAREFDLPLAGGDTAASPNGVLADIVVLGSVPKGKAVLRSGARPGDKIYVTGWLGGAAATLRLLSRGKKLTLSAFRAHFLPTPRIRVGLRLGKRNTAASMIDLSDGLSTDLGHICEESGVGAEIWEEKLPLARLANVGPAGVEDALHGGEDYELLFTARRKTSVPRAIAGVPVSCIGEIRKGENISLVRPDGTRIKLEPQGWEHFRSRL